MYLTTICPRNTWPCCLDVQRRHHLRKSISGVATSGTLTVLHCSVGQRLVRFINIGNPTIVVGVPEGHLRMDAVWVGKEDNNEKKIL